MSRPVGIVILACALVTAAAMAAVRLRADDVTFTQEEIKRILQHSPLRSPPVDTTNRFAVNEKAARLGQFLFFDTRFSQNGLVSCASCHDPTQGLGDGRRLSQGMRVVDRHAQSLWNMTYNRWFFWDGRADSLWSQALIPLEREDEMGGDRVAILRAIATDDHLSAAYESVFGERLNIAGMKGLPARAKPMPDTPHDPRHIAWFEMRAEDRHAVNTAFANIGKALAAYQSKLVSRDAPFDRFVEGLRSGDGAGMAAISASAKRGAKIFVGRGNCRLCHAGPNFTDGEFHSVALPTLTGDEPTDAARYVGVDSLKASEFNAGGAYSDDRSGAASRRLAALINKPDNWGQFKTPSLRSVALSPPYMHQGQYLTLDEVIEHYSTLADAVQLGHHREKILQPLLLTDVEKADLKAFLEALTGAALPPELVSKPNHP